MTKNYPLLMIILIFLLLAVSVLAQNYDTNTTTEFNETNVSENVTINITQPTPNSNETSNTTNKPEETDEDEEEAISNFKITNFVPVDFKIGDVQINIQVMNTGNTKLKDLTAIITGKGFSSYDVIPIDTLKPGEKSYILVSGNFREPGKIKLKIKIEDKTFYQEVNVIDPSATENAQKLKEIEEAEARKKLELANISKQLENLESKYIELERKLEQKREEKYDVADINLEDLKKYIRNGQSSVIVGSLENAKANLLLAIDEYDYQKSKLDNAKPIKKTIVDRMRENAVIISSIVGAIIALFTLYEILKKKKEQLYQKIKEVKVSGDAKIVIKKKRKKSQNKKDNKEDKKNNKEGETK